LRAARIANDPDCSSRGGKASGSGKRNTDSSQGGTKAPKAAAAARAPRKATPEDVDRPCPRSLARQQRIAVGYAANRGTRAELIFNPTTGVLLAERFVANTASDGVRPGTVTAWTAIEDQAIVHSNHQRPGSGG
jgi:hypothetical protein